jgi:hypothetical protein
VNKRGPWIETHTGRKFFVLDPRPEDFNVEDLAHSLSNLCRFNGHTSKFYSVAQHSVIVSQIVEPEWGTEVAMWGLFHEVDEPYLGDIPTPVKFALGYDKLKEISRRYVAAAGKRFKLGPYPSTTIKNADLIALVTEKRDLLSKRFTRVWFTDYGLPIVKPLPITIEPWGPAKAKRRFLERYHQLRGR